MVALEENTQAMDQTTTYRCYMGAASLSFYITIYIIHRAHMRTALKNDIRIIMEIEVLDICHSLKFIV